jgi:hypothetical protein
MNLPQADLATRLEELPRDRPIYVICQGGFRSLRSAQFLKQAGFSQVASVKGGTLAWEAAALLAERLEDVAPDVSGHGKGHRVVDAGADVFTVGRPHPMIDGGVRREWIAREAADPTTAVLLFDVVLGYGAHPDPAGELIPALEAARRTTTAAGRGLAKIASVTGTEADPQRRSTQVAKLRAAGAAVMDSNAQAARLAALVAARQA